MLICTFEAGMCMKTRRRDSGCGTRDSGKAAVLAPVSCYSNMQVHPEMLLKTKERGKYGTWDKGHGKRAKLGDTASGS